MTEKLHETPLGTFRLSEKNGAIVSCQLYYGEPFEESDQPSIVLHRSTLAIDSYFQGDLEALCSIPINAQGTTFQEQVWKVLTEIPCGSTLSYSDVAKSIGRDLASRAVGMACNRNPILLFIPCHRVIGKDQKLTGFNGGVEKKQFLLQHEGVLVADEPKKEINV
jgi:methylated-DNA-[protein]-cysteine S-methyltransferase